LDTFAADPTDPARAVRVVSLLARGGAMDQPGRDDLARWRAASARGLADAAGGLTRSLGPYLDAESAAPLLAQAREFAAVVAEVLEPAVEAQERSREYPRLRRYDAVGRRVEEVEFHPAHDSAAAAAWGAGLLVTALDHAGAFELAAKFYLLSHVGEGGQACPVVCTVGLRRALEHHGDAAMRERYLAGLTQRDARVALRGSQFLTEVQGGSDVGANVARAVPDPRVPGAWRVTGEKWFCSVADADLFAVTARPDGAGPGTRGLGCFLIARLADDGQPNGCSIRRLKDKLGTRLLASGEIDFDGALAWPIGDVTQGFRIAVGELLNTSRWLNAVGSAGIMDRACLEATTYARHRRAFATTIDAFPAVREQLAVMRAETDAATASTFALTDLVGAIDEGTASPEQVKVHRFLVNANKYVTSIAASDVVHRAIEVLGGNGTIEDFSALPRLYRDAIVFESWEGTHNVLCAQVRRDCARLGLLDALEAWLRASLAGVPAPLAAMARQVGGALDAQLAGLRHALGDDARAEARFRHQLEALMHVVQAACLLREATLGDAPASAVAALFIERHLAPLGDEGPTWGQLVDAVAGAGPREAVPAAAPVP
jgi:alkylation response protein AidB-like acyl-CoA dehydrogenase